MARTTVIIPEHEVMVANILDVYNSATADQFLDGSNWYRDSFRIVKAFADQYGYSRSQVAGVIAAVSPLNSWGHNVNLAGRIIEGHWLNIPVTSGYLSNGLTKANAILDGGIAEDILKSNKIRNFYFSILTGGSTSAVCVDRHAYSIALGERIVNVPSMTDKRYNAIGDAYRAAAKELCTDASIIQAITWVVWRNRFWAEGAFDGK